MFVQACVPRLRLPLLLLGLLLLPLFPPQAMLLLLAILRLLWVWFLRTRGE